MECLQGTKIVKEIKFEGSSGWVRSKKWFQETVTHRESDTGSSFQMKQRTMGKV